MPALLSIIVFALAYFGLHALAWFSAIRLFGVTSWGARSAWLGLAIALALSFPIASAVSRGASHFLADAFYRLAAAWIGLLIFLTVAFAAAWAIKLALLRADGRHDFLLGGAAVIVALLITTLGLYRGRYPVVTDVAAPLKNLPPAWAGRTVIQLSDVHLGKINGEAFAERLVERVNALRPDLILVTGDLFDGMGSDPAKFIPILNKMSATRGVYFVTGNHEHYLGVEGVLSAFRDSNWRVLNNELVTIDGLQVVGLAFPGLSGETYADDVITSLPGYDRTAPTVLMYHEPVSVDHQGKDGASARGAMYFAPDTDYAVQRDSGVDLQLSGHTHAGQFWPFTFVAERVWHASNYGLSTDGPFTLYTSSGTGTWGPPLRLGTKGEIVRLKLDGKTTP